MDVFKNNEDIIGNYYDYFVKSPRLKEFEQLGGVLEGKHVNTRRARYNELLKKLKYPKDSPSKTYVISKGEEELFVGTLEEIAYEFDTSMSSLYRYLKKEREWEYDIKERTFEHYLNYLKDINA